jgi:hypothetical protein
LAPDRIARAEALAVVAGLPRRGLTRQVTDGGLRKIEEIRARLYGKR